MKYKRREWSIIWSYGILHIVHFMSLCNILLSLRYPSLQIYTFFQKTWRIYIRIDYEKIMHFKLFNLKWVEKLFFAVVLQKRYKEK